MNLSLIFAVVLVIGYDFVNGLDIPQQNSSQPRIVGGKEATQPYPYQVSLGSPRLIFSGVVYTWQHFCGGAIITKRHILTAAHCVIDKNGTLTSNEELSILVGTHHLENGGTRYYPTNILPHPKYLTESPGGCDIAIITIKGTINFIPKKVEPIKYSDKYTGGDVSCVLTGWGSTRELRKGPYPKDLQELNLSTITHQDCQAQYPFIETSNLCTLSAKGKGACDGDSGGPLVDIEEQTLVGITEAVNGGGCALGKPDIFTRVSAFYDWIKEHTKIITRPSMITNVILI